MKIAISGHRPNKLGGDYDLNSPLVVNISTKIVDILEEHRKILLLKGKGEIIEGITGMALGIDQLYAVLCTALSIPFIAAIPFPSQPMMWPIKSRNIYYGLLAKAKEKVYVSDDPFHPAKMQKRNEWMVDNCDLLIAVWDKSPGGTANCVKYAFDKKEIVYINPKTLVL